MEMFIVIQGRGVCWFRCTSDDAVIVNVMNYEGADLSVVVHDGADLSVVCKLQWYFILHEPIYDFYFNSNLVYQYCVVHMIL